LLRAIGTADRIAAFVAQAAGDGAAAEAAGANELDRLADAGVAANLGAGLADLVVMPRRFDEAPAFPDVVAHRFFDVDVLAGLHCPDRGERMPVVRRGDSDGVDFLVVHDAAQVLHDGRGGAALSLGRTRDGAGGDGGIDIA
jgi:hypothetical protein